MMTPGAQNDRCGDNNSQLGAFIQQQPRILPLPKKSPLIKPET